MSCAWLYRERAAGVSLGDIEENASSQQHPTAHRETIYRESWSQHVDFSYTPLLILYTGDLALSISLNITQERKLNDSCIHIAR